MFCCIKVPFLVTSEDIDQTIIGFNAIFELIRCCNSQETNHLFLKTLTSSFVSAKEYEVKSFVNLVQGPRGGDLCDVKTIKKDFVVPKGMPLCVPCRVRLDLLRNRHQSFFSHISMKSGICLTVCNFSKHFS